MNFQKPKSWRKGQTIFNFLEWLMTKKGISTNGYAKMADPFHISDALWDQFYSEFLKENGVWEV